MTAQGHPRTIFRRAVERGNLVVAEVAAREVGNLTLAEERQLVCLYALAQDAKFERAAVKWLGRFVGECSPLLFRAQFALAAPAALRDDGEVAKRVLLELAAAA